MTSSTRRLGILGLLVSLAIVVAACGARPAAQLAQEALDAGLQAHIAGDVDKATAKYQECLKHESASTLCLFNLGVIAQAEGRTAEAQNLYQLALVVDPVFASALYNMAILLTTTSPDEAITLYRRFVEVAPDDVNGHLNLGLLLRSRGDTLGASEQFGRVRALDPTIVIPGETTASPAP